MFKIEHVAMGSFRRGVSLAKNSPRKRAEASGSAAGMPTWSEVTYVGQMLGVAMRNVYAHSHMSSIRHIGARADLGHFFRVVYQGRV
jgi:hypothetical protein